MCGEKITWAIFFSGGGRSAKDCLDLWLDGRLSGHQINCVVTVGQNADNISSFLDRNIKVIDKSPSEFATISDYQVWLANILVEMQVDYLFLIGYKYRIRSILLHTFKNRILNIHPSLLPSFKNTQRAIHEALELGVKISGITTHIIDENIDEGYILDQEAVRIPANTTFSEIDVAFNQAGKILVERTFNLVREYHKPQSYLNGYIENAANLI